MTQLPPSVAPPPHRPRRLTVLETRALGPRMRRITLTGSELRDFPAAGPGAHIKLFLPRPGQEPLLPTRSADGLVWPPGERPAVRTYSLRSHDPARDTVDVDFVLHGDEGPASRWAARARAGDPLGMAGPGGPPLLAADADFHLLAGDLSALPAIAAVLEALPATARGVALVEVADDADQQPLRHPPGLKVHWVQRPKTPPREPALASAVQALPWPAAPLRISATIAGESSAVIAIRRHLLFERSLARDALYAVPYWRRGESEERYHEERHRIMDEVPTP